MTEITRAQQSTNTNSYTETTNQATRFSIIIIILTLGFITALRRKYNKKQ